MGLVLFVFLVFPKVFRKPKKPSGKPEYQRKTTKKKKTYRKKQNTKYINNAEPNKDMKIVQTNIEGIDHLRIH